MRKLLVSVLVLVGLLLAADFGAAAAAEYRISQQLRSEFDLSRDPAVRIHGFPFLTQALSGQYSHIEVQATGLPVGPLTDVAVAAGLYDVTAPLDELMSGSLSTVQIDEVEGRVLVKDTDIGRAIGIEDLRISRPSEEEIRKVLGPAEVDESKEAAGEADGPGTGFDGSEAGSDDSDSGSNGSGSGSDGSDAGSDDSEAGSDGSESDESGSGSDESGSAAESREDERAPIRLVATTDLVGERTEVILIGMLQLDSGVMRVVPADVRLSTDDVGEFSLPQPFRGPLLDVFTFTIDPGGLPFTVTPEEVHVQTGAIIVEGTASDVSFSQAGLGSQ